MPSLLRRLTNLMTSPAVQCFVTARPTNSAKARPTANPIVAKNPRNIDEKKYSRKSHELPYRGLQAKMTITSAKMSGQSMCVLHYVMHEFSYVYGDYGIALYKCQERSTIPFLSTSYTTCPPAGGVGQRGGGGDS